MTLLNGDEFNRLFSTFDRSARRLEARDRYDVISERPYITRYLAGMQEDDEHVASRKQWLEGTVRATVAAGRRWQRVRVVPDQFTDYLRYVLRGTRQTVQAGEDVRYLPRPLADELDLPDHDYWLFDDSRLALLHFTADDRPLGALVVTEPDVVAQYKEWLDRAADASVPYVEFLAQDPSREHPAGRA